MSRQAFEKFINSRNGYNDACRIMNEQREQMKIDADSVARYLSMDDETVITHEGTTYIFNSITCYEGKQVQIREARLIK